MATEIKVINNEGKAETITLPDTVKSVDFGAMGVHSAEEVTSIKLKAENEAKATGDRALSELRTSNDTEKASLEAKLAEFTAKKDGGNAENIAMKQAIDEQQKAIKTLTDAITSEKAEKMALQYNQELKSESDTLKLAGDAAETFALIAKSKKKIADDGGVSYTLANGLPGTLKEFTSEFKESTVGKSLMVSTQAGGSGSNPGGDPPPPGGVVKSLSEFRTKHRT